MKNFLLLICLLLLTTFSNAQEPPVLKTGKTQVGLSSLDITVEIVGNIATTTFDMLYYNPKNEVLEGELSFPLGENFNVSRFALDVNGKLREAVVVDKELGRIAFEAVVRRRVDPALLEKGTGNNYKARIYPIPAKGYKRVVLAYEQELINKKDGFYFDLPLNFKNKLDKFNLEITVFEQEDSPVIEEGNVSGLKFENWQRNFRTKVQKENYTPNKSILIKIPTKVDSKKIVIFDDYFYAHTILNPKKKIRKKATEITIFWDASLSMKDRDLAKEIELLDRYFSYIENVKVHFKSFSNVLVTEKTYNIRNGNWNDLKSELKNTIYDGGTNYTIKDAKHKNVDLVLLFSDGIQSLSDETYTSTIPLIAVNSLTKSNHAALNKMAQISNGTYLNLTSKTALEAFSDLKYEQYRFLGFTSNAKNIDVYPNMPVNVGNTFSIAGKNINNSDSVILHFGYGTTVEQSVVLNLKDGQKNVTTVPRMWAQKKLVYLQKNAKENKSQIVNLGTNYGLVTDYTSLIVLEAVMDYVRYKIEPPAELLEEYNKILADIELNKKKYPNGMPPPIHELIDVVEDDMEIEESVIEFRSTNSFRGNTNTQTSFQFDTTDEVQTQSLVPNRILNVEADKDIEIEEVPFSIIEDSPVFPGCESIGNRSDRKRCFSQKIQKHVEANFNMALVSTLNLPEGRQRATAMFTITETGTIETILVRSSHERISEEVKRVLRLLPQMTPGQQRGKKVSVRYTLPIIFTINANGNTITQTAQSQQNETVIKKPRKPKIRFQVDDLTVNTVYVKELRQFKTKEEAYDFYLIQRTKYVGIPAYYVDVSNLFRDEFKAHDFSERIASNIAETDFDNYELLKVYGYQLQENNQNWLAVFIFKRVLELRSEDSQSYRDLALAYENVGKCQEAFDLFEGIISGEIYKNAHRRNFASVKQIALNEIHHLTENYKGDIDTSALDKTSVPKETFDVRIVVDWNHNDTDIDLHVIDPNLEECSYKHTRTKIGGKISQDMTQGFGPEEFTLKNAIKGDYFVKIKYFGDRYQKIENPTFMKVTLYKYYGTKKETKEVKIIRLAESNEKLIVAKLRF
ncbi:VIT domain-containing protein [Kordia antarctica]|nr:VIT domain-containing protein [Kordia antarctica]